MKAMTIRSKITMWFSALLVLIVGLMFALMLVISTSVLHTDVKESLLQTVEANAQEIEYFADIEQEEQEAGDHYLIYVDGYLEIDDDFLDEANGVYTALYDPQGNLLYGQKVAHAPITENGHIRTFRAQGETYYVYCITLQGEDLDGLILQGVVNEDANKTVLSRIVHLSLLLLPLIAVIAIVGGYLLAGRFLRPIRQISESAEAIQDGRDLAARIELGAGRDELHRLADTFNRMFERLECSFEDEKQFTADISHELRTPVAAALAQTELALEQAHTPEEYRQALTVINRQCSRMKFILDEMLSFSRLERLEALPETETVDLSELTEFVTEEQALRQERGIVLKSEIESGIQVTGSSGLLAALLQNLISNAYRYGRDGGYIHVKLQQTPQAIRLSVADNGVGIAPEQQDKIFLRFYQADAARQAKDAAYGVGLGLPMADKIARLHGGSIEVESKPGVGSTFTFVLPT